MTLTLYADQCTTCSGETKAYVSILQSFCWDNHVKLEMKSTRYSLDNRIEAEMAIREITPVLGKALVRYSIIDSYPPFIAGDGKSIWLKGITKQKLMELI